VSKILTAFHELAGPSFYRRVDIHFDRATYEGVKRHLLEDLRAAAPAELAGLPVTRAVLLSTNDGFKFFVADGSWLLVRTSGTEPLARIYTEATSADLREAMIEAGERLVRGG
jgi:phosphomannomutase